MKKFLTFQFLIGTVKTSVFCFNVFYVEYVSIPHRYCKNMGLIWWTIVQKLVSIPHRYCKNDALGGLVDGLLEVFQFLIGTVKTWRWGWIIYNFTRVSIPHRYCKNPPISLKGKPSFKVSIPHRYCKNP